MPDPPPAIGIGDRLLQAGGSQENVVAAKVDERAILVVWPEQRNELGPGVVVASGNGLTVNRRVYGLSGWQVVMLGMML